MIKNIKIIISIWKYLFKQKNIMHVNKEAIVPGAYLSFPIG